VSESDVLVLYTQECLTSPPQARLFSQWRKNPPLVAKIAAAGSMTETVDALLWVRMHLQRRSLVAMEIYYGYKTILGNKSLQDKIY
jgi:hypothetical protein